MKVSITRMRVVDLMNTAQEIADSYVAQYREATPAGEVDRLLRESADGLLGDKAAVDELSKIFLVMRVECAKENQDNAVVNSTGNADVH